MVNNIYKPRLWKMVDLPNTFYGLEKFTWTVAAPTARSSRIIVGINAPGPKPDVEFITVMSQSDATVPLIDANAVETSKIVSMAMAVDGEHIAIFYENLILWMGQVTQAGDNISAERICRISLKDEQGVGFKAEEFFWCGLDAVICISPGTAQCLIVAKDG